MFKWFATFVIFFAIVTPGWAQNEYARDRASSARAARLDAMRQLAESIQGVRISASTTVRDFVTEKDEIKTSLENFMRGAQQVGAPVYQPDGTCEVTLSISLNDLIFWLRQAYYRNGSNRINPSQFSQIPYYASKRVFTATGTGAMKGNPRPQHGNFWMRVSPRGKLMALRAAKIDAYRNLAETIKGVRITASTKVEDFVAVSDEIRASFNGFIRGVQFVGRPRYHRDGYVEVTAQVNVDHLINTLQAISRRNNCGNQWNSQKFQNIRQYQHTRILKAAGTGVPPVKYMRRYIAPQPMPNPINPVNPVPPVPPKPYVPEWAKRTVRVTGTGAPADWMSHSQAKSMAKRAAVLDGYRQLNEQIMGLRLDAGTTVSDFVTQNDEISAKTNGFIKGAQIEQLTYQPDGTAEVTMSLYLGHMWRIIEASYRRSH